MGGSGVAKSRPPPGQCRRKLLSCRLPSSGWLNGPIDNERRPPMTITAEKMAAWCRGILGDNPDVPKLPLEKYLAAIPRLESLADLPSGTPVLVRGDVDAKPGAKVGDGDIRLRSMKDTLDYGRQKGWKQIVSSATSAASRRSRWRRSATGWPKSSAARWASSPTGSIRPRRRSRTTWPPGDPHRRAGQRASCWKTRGSTTSSACSGRPSRPTCPKLADRLAKLANEFAAEGGQGLHPRGLFGRQPRRLERDRAGGHGPRGPGRV